MFAALAEFERELIRLFRISWGSYANTLYHRKYGRARILGYKTPNEVWEENAKLA